MADAADRADAPVAVVTGGAAGMGRAHVLALLADGWRVCAIDRDGERLAAQADEAAGKLSFAVADLRDPAARDRITTHVLEEFGYVDGLVNNAGYGLQRPLTEHEPADVADQLAIHVEATLALSEAFAAALASRRGAIVNVSSTYALAGPCTYPNPPAVAYCAAKAGVIGLTSALARRFAPDVRVNAIAPGGALTETTVAKYSAELLERKISGVPARRWARPDEYAVFVRYLLSPRAVGVSGQVLSPNGGEVIARS